MKQLRRTVLGMTASVGLLSGCFSQAALRDGAAVAATTPAPDSAAQSLSFENLHTGERLSVVFARQGRKDPQAMAQISHVLRDHRTGESIAIDPRLVDTLFEIKTELLQRGLTRDVTFQVISGYRSVETNDNLRRNGGGQAERSQHSRGTAIDIRVPGVALSEVRDAAWCLQNGGVGFYPQSHNNFVHVDTGRVRFWPAQTTRWRCPF